MTEAQLKETVNRLQHQAAEAERRMRSQSETFSRLLNSDLLSLGNLELALATIVESLADTLLCTRAGFWLADESFETLTAIDIYHRARADHHSGAVLSAATGSAFLKAAHENPILAIENAQSDRRSIGLMTGWFIPQKIQGLMTVQVRARGSILGLLILEQEEPRKWQADEQNFVSAVAGLISMAFEARERNQADSGRKAASAELEKLNEELKAVIAEKDNMLNQLKSTQENLIFNEKMASLGQLMAGVAHEINTPLGAIDAATFNLSKSFPLLLQALPNFFRSLNAELEALFFQMIDISLNNQLNLSSREERQYRKEVTEKLEKIGVPNAAAVAKDLIKIGIINDLDVFAPLLKNTNSEQTIEMVSAIGRFRLNLDNIKLAFEKTKKIVFALKSYSHRDVFDQMELTNLIENIETVLIIYHNQIKYGIELTKNFEPNLPRFYAYPDKLNQVWTNILHNAIQAMKGTGKIQIDVFREGDNFVVKITDSGPGIPVEIQQKIFDPFFTTKPQGEGSGLGLNICKKIVQEHEGELSVDSVPGRTTFIVVLPIRTTPINTLQVNNPAPVAASITAT